MMQRLRYRGLKWQVIVMLWFGNGPRVDGLLDQLMAEFPQDDYALATRAHLLAQARDRQAALRCLRTLVEVFPDKAAHWFNLGFLLEDLGHFQEAEPAFRRATELDPKLDRAWYGLGLVLIRLERFDEAVTALKQNTKLQPMSPYGWYQLARVHVDRHDPEEARKIIRHLKRFEPKVAAQLERETGIFVPPAS